MKKIVAGTTMGLDLGDRSSYVVVVDEEGEIVHEGRVETRTPALAKLFSGMARMRVVMEAGSSSGWVSRLALSWGHEALVANPRQVALVTRSLRKTDRLDAETLARMGRLDPKLLKPIRHRQVDRQKDLTTLRCRDQLVNARTGLVCLARGTLKQYGIRVGRCSTEAFADRASEKVPEELGEALGPVLSMLRQLCLQIRAMDQTIGRLCEEKYPETGALRQIRGVGPITALAFVLCLESPERFASNRDAGAFAGLTPGSRQSGDQEAQLGITKAGDGMLRRLLVNCAQYILGPFGMDCDLRRHGDKIRARGGRIARKRAVVATARKLAVLMLRLWRTGEVWEPLHNEGLAGAV